MVFILVLFTWLLIFAFLPKVLRDGTQDKIIAERMAYREKNNREAVETINKIVQANKEEDE